MSGSGRPQPSVSKTEASGMTMRNRHAFSPAGAAVYQLGPFGTAAKKLKEWDLKP